MATAIAAIGSGTAKALKTFNLSVDFTPSTATVEAFVRRLTQAQDLSHLAVIRIRRNLSDKTVENTLQNARADVIPLNVYRAYYPMWPDGMNDKLFDYPPKAIIFTSSSTVDGLFVNLTENQVRRLTGDAVKASIGPLTTKALEAYGLTVSVEAKEHTVSALIEDIEEHFHKNPGG